MFTATVREVLTPISDTLAQLVVLDAELASKAGGPGWPDLTSFASAVADQVVNLVRAAEHVLASLEKIKLGNDG